MLAFIDKPFAAIAAGGGPSKDELKLLFSMFLSYPLAGILKRLPDAKAWQKNLFIILASLFVCTGIFDLWTGFLCLVISSLVTYYIAATVRSPYMPWITFVGLMGHMLYLHAYRELFPQPGVVDITGAQMVLVMKLSAFCWSVHDGRLPESELSDHQKNRAIRTMPGLLDYLAYVLFFPALFAGPAFDYAEYQRWIDTSMFDVVVHSSKSTSGTKRKRRIPSSSKPATIKALWSIFWFAASIKAKELFNEEHLLSEEFLSRGVVSKIWYLYAFAFASRLKYYGAWSLSEGACILSGLGYNGVDPVTKKLKWDRLTNIEPWKIETAENARAFLESWNMNTNYWLKNYVYLRITPKGKKPGFRSTLGTFTTSALWHGISPGYYFTFATGAFIQTIAKYLRRYLRPFFLHPSGTRPGPYKRAYDIAGIVLTQITFAYTVTPFLVLDRKKSIKVWSRYYFFIHIGIVVLYAFFHSPVGRGLGKVQKRRVERYLAEKKKKKESADAGTESPSDDGSQLQRENAEAAMGAAGQPGPLGMPEDVERDVIEAARVEIEEIKEEIKAKKAHEKAGSKGENGVRDRRR